MWLNLFRQWCPFAVARAAQCSLSSRWNRGVVIQNYYGMMQNAPKKVHKTGKQLLPSVCCYSLVPVLLWLEEFKQSYPLASEQRKGVFSTKAIKVAAPGLCIFIGLSMSVYPRSAAAVINLLKGAGCIWVSRGLLLFWWSLFFWEVNVCCVLLLCL